MESTRAASPASASGPRRVLPAAGQETGGARVDAMARFGQGVTTPTGNLLQLHRSAGNQAVASLVSRLIQRCGPVPCSCSPAEREQAEAQNAASSSVQRALPSDLRVKG